jgi:hypothetical protein
MRRVVGSHAIVELPCCADNAAAVHGAEDKLAVECAEHCKVFEDVGLPEDAVNAGLRKSRDDAAE